MHLVLTKSLTAARKQTLAHPSIALIFLYNTNPFITGILISNSTRSYEFALKLDSASRESLYGSTSNNPLPSRARLKELVISGSSSTIKSRHFFTSIFIGDGISGRNEILHNIITITQTSLNVKWLIFRVFSNSGFLC